MSAEDSTPCQTNPEAWVGDDDRTRAQAARECAKCPLTMFAACQKLAKVSPFGVLAGRDYGTTIKSAARIQAAHDNPIAEDVKECEACGVTIRRGNRDTADWVKLRYCSKKCYGSTMVVHGLPESKVCEWCAQSFGRDGRAPAHWSRARFCGVKCAGAYSGARRKGTAA